MAKDVGAMQVKGGYIVIGVDDNGEPTGAMDGANASPFDPANLVPEMQRYLDGSLDIATGVLTRDGHTIVLVCVKLTFAEIKELANTIGRPPYQWTPERLWEAYETLDRSKVRGSGRRVLTDIVSLVRFALAYEDELVSYPELVRERFQAWLLAQDNAGRTFTADQLAWLEQIREHVAASLAIDAEDFEYVPFVEQGGVGRAYELFGEGLAPLLDELNKALAA
jgi:hypothetical protein